MRSSVLPPPASVMDATSTYESAQSKDQYPWSHAAGSQAHSDGFEARVEFLFGNSPAFVDRGVQRGVQGFQARLTLFEEAQAFPHDLARGAIPTFRHDAVNEMLPAIPKGCVHGHVLRNSGGIP